MPASRAAWMVAMLSDSSLGPYIPDIAMQPSATRETCGPFFPSRTCLISMTFATSIVKRHDDLANLRGGSGERRRAGGSRCLARVSGRAGQRGRGRRVADPLERD